MGSHEPAARDRATHRLEAFSDIVIGFSLAQLALTLVIPAHAVEFVQHPAGISAFIVTFIVIVRFWWVNYIIFERYYRPNRLMITLNFIALASLILQVFSLQLYLHFVPLGEGGVASRIYFAFFALSYGTQGVMLAVGLLYRRKEISALLRRAGIGEVLARAGIVTGAVVGNVRVTHDVARVVIQVGKQATLFANLPSSLFFDTVIGAFAGLIASWIFPFVSRRYEQGIAAPP